MSKLITAYCLSRGHFTVIPHQLAENFQDMVDCGFTAVALTFGESEMCYSKRAFEIQVNLAKAAGLKVFVLPSRLGGRFSGAPLTPSIWGVEHPESQVPGFSGFNPPVACLENQAFRDWIKGFMTTLLTDYPLDGIIWDEPKHEKLISLHPDTRAWYGDHPTVENMEDGYVDFLRDLTAHCLAIKNDLLITVSNQKTSSERFTQATAAIEGISYAGYDGNLARESFFHEEPRWIKYRLESVWDRTVRECRQAGKKTWALVENFLMPSVAIPEYEENFEAYLQAYRPDNLGIYYYAANNEDPEAVHEITRRLMKKYLR